MEWVFRQLWFAAKHLALLAVVSLLGCVLWTLLYLGLLLWAVVTDGGVGGPLAWPAGILMVLLGCAAFGFGVAFPACAAALFVRRRRGWPRMAEIPLSFLAACGLWIGWVCLIERGLPRLMDLAVSLLWMPLPLGVWWWFAEGPGALWDAVRRWKAGRPA